MKNILLILAFISFSLISYAQEDKNNPVKGSDVDQATMDSLGFVNPKISEMYNNFINRSHC